MAETRVAEENMPPPTPLPPLSFHGYASNTRPTYKSWRDEWHQNCRRRDSDQNNNYNNNDDDNDENGNINNNNNSDSDSCDGANGEMEKVRVKSKSKTKKNDKILSNANTNTNINHLCNNDEIVNGCQNYDNFNSSNFVKRLDSYTYDAGASVNENLKEMYLAPCKHTPFSGHEQIGEDNTNMAQDSKMSRDIGVNKLRLNLNQINYVKIDGCTLKYDRANENAGLPDDASVSDQLDLSEGECELSEISSCHSDSSCKCHGNTDAYNKVDNDGDFSHSGATTDQSPIKTVRNNNHFPVFV